MKYKVIPKEECKCIQVGAAISLTAVMAVICAAVMAVVVYKLFTSKKGTTSVPGGWKFTWN